jgi:hypothetical protein
LSTDIKKFFVSKTLTQIKVRAYEMKVLPFLTEFKFIQYEYQNGFIFKQRVELSRNRLGESIEF